MFVCILTGTQDAASHGTLYGGTRSIIPDICTPQQLPSHEQGFSSWHQSCRHHADDNDAKQAQGVRELELGISLGLGLGESSRSRRLQGRVFPMTGMF